MRIVLDLIASDFTDAKVAGFGMSVGIGRPVLNTWMAPAFWLNDQAIRIASPYVDLGRWAGLVGA